MPGQDSQKELLLFAQFLDGNRISFNLEKATALQSAVRAFQDKIHTYIHDANKLIRKSKNSIGRLQKTHLLDETQDSIKQRLTKGLYSYIPLDDIEQIQYNSACDVCSRFIAGKLTSDQLLAELDTLQKNITKPTSNLRRHILRAIIEISDQLNKSNTSNTLIQRAALNSAQQQQLDKIRQSIPYTNNNKKDLEGTIKSIGLLETGIEKARVFITPVENIINVDYYLLAETMAHFEPKTLTIARDWTKKTLNTLIPSYEDRQCIQNLLPSNLFIPTLALIWKKREATLYLQKKILGHLSSKRIPRICDERHFAVLQLSTKAQAYNQDRKKRSWIKRFWNSNTRERQTNAIISNCEAFLTANTPDQKNGHLYAIAQCLAKTSEQTTRASFLSWLGFREKKMHTLASEHQSAIINLIPKHAVTLETPTQKKVPIPSDEWQIKFPTLHAAFNRRKQIAFMTLSNELLSFIENGNQLHEDMIEAISFDAQAIDTIFASGYLESSGILKALLSRTQNARQQTPEARALQRAIQTHATRLIRENNLNALEKFTPGYEDKLRPTKISSSNVAEAIDHESKFRPTTKIPYSAVAEAIGYKTKLTEIMLVWLSFTTKDIQAFADHDTLLSSGLMDHIITNEGNPQRLSAEFNEAIIQYRLRAIKTNTLSKLNEFHQQFEKNSPLSYLPAQKGKFFVPFERIQSWLIESLESDKTFNADILDWISVSYQDLREVIASFNTNPGHLVVNGFIQAILQRENKLDKDQQDEKILSLCQNQLNAYFSSHKTVTPGQDTQALTLLEQLKDKKGVFSNLSFIERMGNGPKTERIIVSDLEENGPLKDEGARRELSSAQLAQRLEAMLWITRLHRMTNDSLERVCNFVDLFPFYTSSLETIQRVEKAITQTASKWLASLTEDEDYTEQLLRIGELFETITKRVGLYEPQPRPDATLKIEILLDHFIRTKNWGQIGRILRGDLTFNTLVKWDIAEKMRSYIIEHLNTLVSNINYDAILDLLHGIAKADIVFRAQFSKVAKNQLEKLLENREGAAAKLEAHPLAAKLELLSYACNTSKKALLEFKTCFNVDICSKQLVGLYSKLVLSDKKAAFAYVKTYLQKFISLETNPDADLTNTAQLVLEITRLAEILEGFRAIQLLDTMKADNENEHSELEAQLDSFKASYPAWISLLQTARRINTQTKKSGAVYEELSVKFGDNPSDSANWSIPDYVCEFIRVLIAEANIKDSCSPSTRAMPDTITGLLNNKNIISVADAQKQFIFMHNPIRAQSRIALDTDTVSSIGSLSAGVFEATNLIDPTYATKMSIALLGFIEKLCIDISNHPDMSALHSKDFKKIRTEVMSNSKYEQLYPSAAALEEKIGLALSKLSEKQFKWQQRKQAKLEAGASLVISLNKLKHQIDQQTVTDEHAVFLLECLLTAQKSQIPDNSKKYAGIIQTANDTLQKDIKRISITLNQTPDELSKAQAFARECGVNIDLADSEDTDSDTRSNRSNSVSSGEWEAASSPALFPEYNNQDNVLDGLDVKFSL